mmetsp:Transcript_12530/g.22121  ORF Transcript_12530/g.22121 Transcript_12530/m.22121 type:complete len:533 (+) Transcript_12530:93-1691(+)
MVLPAVERHTRLLVGDLQGGILLEQASDFVQAQVQDASVHAAGGLEVLLALLLAISGLAFLAPARVAYGLGRMWHASIFALMAGLLPLYHACDDKLSAAFGLASLPGSFRTSLRLADHGCVYFCILQLGFLALGPEDPIFQWMGESKITRENMEVLSSSPPWDIVLLIRVVPAVAMIVFLSSCPPWEDFHWQAVVLLDVLWLLGLALFWLHPKRSKNASKVLVRMGYWLRLWKHAVLPLSVLMFLLVGFTANGSKALHASWHFVLAYMAVSVVRTVISQSSADALRESQRLEECQGSSPAWNPVVASKLLFGAGLVGVPTLVASAIMNFHSLHSWTWPLLSMPMMTRPGGYLVVLGALPALAALGAAFWLIGSSGPCPAFGERDAGEDIPVSKKMGVMLGYLSVAFGLACVASGGFLPRLHCCCLLSFFVFMVMAMAMTAASTLRTSLSQDRTCLYVATAASCTVTLSFVVLFVLSSQYIQNSYYIPQPILAMSEYLSTVSILLWPLCWSSEVHVGWQAHKAWRMSPPSQMA